jgi:AraC-like DNA-binding protein
MSVVFAKLRKQLSPLERFIGEDALVVNSETLLISNYIHAEWSEVSQPEDNVQEDQGMLYLFPIDQNQYSLQLCFMQYEEGTSLNATVCTLNFLPPFFDQYPPETLFANQPFRFDESTEQQFPICSQTQQLLRQLKQSTALTPFTKMLQQNELAMHLLRRALECITIPFTVCQVPACRFLMYESEREKIKEARVLLEQNISDTFTIRELSRKVAMNECYLKKGFKALVGKTIHDYQQELRAGRAKELLKEGHTVTDVANTLGYSSISHFSAAFKRITGMKPCELLS